MKPIEPNDIDGISTTYLSTEPGIEPLPARVSEGIVYTRWQLSGIERLAILDGACIDVAIMLNGRSLQPIAIAVQGVTNDRQE
jgi:hypothetical protein